MTFHIPNYMWEKGWDEGYKAGYQRALDDLTLRIKELTLEEKLENVA